MTDTIRALLERSNRLGADPRNTNYAGGNGELRLRLKDHQPGLHYQFSRMKKLRKKLLN